MYWHHSITWYFQIAKLPLKSKQPHTNNFIYSVMVIKGDKAESSLLPSRAFLHDINAFNLSIFLKILADVVFLSVLLYTTNEDLLHCQMGTWFIGVLKQRVSVSAHTTNMLQYLPLGPGFVYLSGHSPLGFNNSAIHFMRPCFHGIIDFSSRGIRYKAKPSGSFAVGVPHHLETTTWYILLMTVRLVCSCIHTLLSIHFNNSPGLLTSLPI